MSRDISIQVVRLAVDHCRKRGIAVEPLLAGLGFSAADLRDRSRFISWDDCVELAERLCDALGGPEAYEAWGAEAVESHPAVRVVGSLLLGLRSFCVVLVERVCRPYYPCLGMRAEEVARSLAISPRTVEIHVSRVLSKLGTTSRSELIARFWSTRTSSSAPPPA